MNRPVVVKRGWICETTTNAIEAYIGEWAVLRMDNGVEIRMPFEHAIENGLVVTRNEYGRND